jgi:hypothetical protein
MAQETEAQIYRRKAREAREQAIAVPDGTYGRDALLRIAAEYDALAEMLEKTEGLQK